MTYEFIHSYRSEFSVEEMCQVLTVSRSGYYGWTRREESPKSKEDRVLFVVINGLFEKHKKRYGAPRIAKDLKEDGISCGRHRTARIMRENGLKAKAREKFKATTDSCHTLPVAPNLLNQDFKVNRPNQVWVSDITYIWTREGWMYLCTIIDLYSRKVVGWAMNKRMKKDLVIRALDQAYHRRRPGKGLIFHSDRGSQYASHAFRKRLAKYQMFQSMSGKGNCYDNAVAESFFRTLKTELVYWEVYYTRDQAKQSIFEYIEVYYNRFRRHSFIDYFTPDAFERRSMLKCA